MNTRPFFFIVLFSLAGAAQANPDCWIRQHAGEDLGAADAVDTLPGPANFATLQNLPGATKTDWADAVNSLEIGPKARGFFWALPA